MNYIVIFCLSVNKKKQIDMLFIINLLNDLIIHSNKTKLNTISYYILNLISLVK